MSTPHTSSGALLESAMWVYPVAVCRYGSRSIAASYYVGPLLFKLDVWHPAVNRSSLIRWDAVFEIATPALYKTYGNIFCASELAAWKSLPR